MKVLALLLLWTSIAFAQADALHPIAAAAGMYWLSNGASVTFPNPLPTGITGVTIRVTWKQIETSDRGYSWTTLDASIAALPNGVPVALVIKGGVQTPDWALNKYEADTGGVVISYWDKSFAAGTQNTNNYPANTITQCGLYEIPNPLDPTYQTDSANFAADLATHMAATWGNHVVRVWPLLTEGSTEETYLMDRVATGNITCGVTPNQTVTAYGECAGTVHNATCNPTLDTSRWQAVGYTPTGLVTAFTTLLQSWATQFPGTELISSLVPGDFPPINDSGGTTGGSQDTTMRVRLRTAGYVVSTKIFCAQESGVTSAFWPPWNTPQQGCIAAQVTTDNQSNVDALMTLVVQQDSNSLEIYPTDAQNTNYNAWRTFGDTGMKTRLSMKAE